jgi:hypothetical protein
VDPGRRQRGPARGLARVLGQAKAVRAVGEHVHGVRNTAGRERRGQAINSLPNLAAATKIWRKLFDNEEQLARDAYAFLSRRSWTLRR